MAIRAFITRHPIVSYCVLVMLWSFGWWTLALTRVSIGAFFEPPLDPAVIGCLLAGLLAPSLFGLVLERIINGRGGARVLLGQMGRWRVGWWWLTLFIPVGLNVGVYYAYALSTGSGMQLDFAAKLGPAIGIGLCAALFEELGWRGFLLPRLQRRYSSLRAALLVGLIWGGTWHLYGDYVGAFGHLSWWGVALTVMQAPVLLTAFSVLLTWIYNGTRSSMLLCVAFHFAISWSGFILTPQYPSSPVYLLWATIFALLCWLVAGAAVAMNWRAFTQPATKLRGLRTGVQLAAVRRGAAA